MSIWKPLFPTRLFKQQTEDSALNLKWRWLIDHFFSADNKSICKKAWSFPVSTCTCTSQYETQEQSYFDLLCLPEMVKVLQKHLFNEISVFLYKPLDICGAYLPRYIGIHRYSWPGITLSLPPGLPQSAVPLELSWTVLNWGNKVAEIRHDKEWEKKRRKIVKSNCNTVCVSVFTLLGCSVAAACYISLKAQTVWPRRVYVDVNTTACHLHCASFCL